MKFLVSQVSAYLEDRSARQNVSALGKYLAFLVVVIAIFAVLFHVIMEYEGQDHSWLTGFYWTLTVMSTLGFGDITFTSDLGRAFSLIVLATGIILLLIVLPFAFIRYFYAPWLEAQVRLQAPRELPEGTSGHVLICHYDAIAPGLIERLAAHDIPHVILEPDTTRAIALHAEGLVVLNGELDAVATYEAARIHQARMVLANCEDTTNTNITITAREVAPDVPVVATAEQEASIDILELSGASHVLPLKRWLGEQLAGRVNAIHAEAHVIGTYRDLLIAELPVHGTPFARQTIRETSLRASTGVSVIGVWERGRLKPARPDVRLDEHAVPVILGTRRQLDALDRMIAPYDINPSPVVVLGCGKVGRSAVRSLKRRGVQVCVVERHEERLRRVRPLIDRIVIGDAADRECLDEAGIDKTPSVLLTTNDDAMNIYLAVYCRKLNPEVRIVSRVTHERNFEALYRAGADFVLSFASLGARAVMSLVQHKELVVLGEGVDVFSIPTPEALFGKTLAESQIGARTGLNVVAVVQDGVSVSAPAADFRLQRGSELLAVGTSQQRQELTDAFRTP